MKNVMTRFLPFVIVKSEKIEDIAEVKVKFIAGNLINNREVETKIEDTYYKNGRILSKHYINNRLCMISMSKSL